MARGITEDDVRAAADALLQRGERPTIDRVRAALGRGSPNTVNRHLDAWWASLPRRLRESDAPASDAPPEVVALAGRIWAQLLPSATAAAKTTLQAETQTLEQARHAVEQRETAVEAQRRELTEARAALDRRIGELEAQLAARDQSLAEARTQVQLLTKGLETAQQTLRETVARADQAEAQQRAEMSRLQERLAGTERHLMEKLAAEKTSRHTEQRGADKRAKELEAQLKAAQQQVREQAEAALALQRDLRQELDGLRRQLEQRPAGQEQLLRRGAARRGNPSVAPRGRQR